jgi:(2R)-sulfolactate sulfo-lyase subunit alpha
MKQEGQGRMAIPHVLAHEHKDNVAVVVVEGVTKGMKLLGVVTADDSTFEVESKADVPIGHKIALADLKKGDTAIKYGEDIGRFVENVAKGDHVHVHNLKTKRW